MEQDGSDDVKAALQGKSDISKKTGRCEDGDMKTDMNGGMRYGNVVEEMEEVYDGRWYDEVTTAEVRCCIGKKGGGNGKEG